MTVRARPQRRKGAGMISHFRRPPHVIVAAMIAAITAMAFAQQKKHASPGSSVNEPPPKLLTLREQTEVRERWLKTRLDTMLLPMMRRHGVSMWIITTEEFHPDTIAEYVAPPIPY